MRLHAVRALALRAVGALDDDPEADLLREGLRAVHLLDGDDAVVVGDVVEHVVEPDGVEDGVEGRRYDARDHGADLTRTRQTRARGTDARDDTTGSGVAEQLDPAPFLRGNAFPPADDVPYPRVPAFDRFRLTPLTWQAATVPAGVRLELDGDATAVIVHYTTATGDSGVRGDGGGLTFEAWTRDERIDAVPAVVGAGTAELRLGTRPGPVTIHLPEVMRPRIDGLEPVGGELVPGADKPRWVAYGDSILEGWVASAPARSWAAQVARTLDLDLVNLGYAGAARGEIASAEAVAGLDASVVTLSYGTNCWSMIPNSNAMLTAGFDAFLTIVREGHPTTPLVVVSPIRRPDAEATPNRLGATLASLRAAIEEVTEARQADDPNLVLVRGEPLVADAQLPDRIHPDDDGHAAIAAAVGDAIGTALRA